METRRKFRYDGEEYVETTTGYCYRDRKRIPASEFAKALAEKEAGMNVIKVGDVEYRNDWGNSRYYRGDEEISRDEFLRAMGSESGRKSRPRRSKGAAFEHDGVTVTARQAEFLRAMSSESSQGSPDDGWQIDVLIDGAGLMPMSAGAMVSTLREKGLVEVSAEIREDGKRARKVKHMRLTEAGRAVWDAMGL